MGTGCSSIPNADQPSSSLTKESIHVSISNKVSKSKTKISSIFALSDTSVSDQNESSVYQNYEGDEQEPTIPEVAIRPPTDNRHTADYIASPLKPIGQYGKLKIPSISEFSTEFKDMISGQLSKDLLDNEDFEKRMIYVYHLAQYSDSKDERNALQFNVYEELKEYCRRKDVTLEIIDLSWNLKDYYAHGHACRHLSPTIISRLLSREIKNSIFTIFVNEKYGVYWCPLTIEKELFEDVLKKCTENDKQFLFETYTLDESLETSSYVLQPIENHTPKYSQVGVDFESGINERQKQEIRLRNIFAYAATPESQKLLGFMSDLERDVELILKEQRALENMIWLKRKFTNVVWEETSTLTPLVDKYKTMNGNQVNECAESKLQALINRLDDELDTSNIIQHELEWSLKEINSTQEQRDKYISQLCKKYKVIVKEKIDKMLEEFEKKKTLKRKMVNRGATYSMLTDLSHQSKFALTMQQNALGHNEFVSESLEDFIKAGGLVDDIKSKPLILHGDEGIGKSTLASVMANNIFTVDGWKNCCCIFKSAQASREAMTLEQMVLNIGEHLCLLSDIPIKKVYQHKANILHYLLNATSPRINTYQNILIILDGLDQLQVDNTHEYGKLTWLPKEFPKCVRMIITVTSDSDTFSKLQKYIPNALYVDIPKLNLNESLAILSENLKSSNQIISPDIHNEIQPLLSHEPTPLMVKELASLLKLRRLSVKDILFEDTSTHKDLFHLVLDMLEKMYNKYYVVLICCLMALTRYGISVNEILDIASCSVNSDVSIIQSLEHTVLIEEYYTVKYVPSVQLYAIMAVLAPFLLQTVCHGVILIKWRHPVLKSLILEKYASLKNDVIVLLDNYYSQKQITYVQNLSEHLKDKSSLNNITCLPHQSRVLDELPWLSQNTYNTVEDIFKFILTKSFMTNKVMTCGVQHLIKDIIMLIIWDKTTKEEDFVFLYDILTILTKLRPILVIDPSAFESQVQNYLHMNNNTKQFHSLKTMYFFQNSESHVSEVKRLCPILGTKNFCFGYRADDHGNYTFSGLYHVPGDPNHVIALSTMNDEVCIINVHTGEPHRVFRGINKPRDLRAISTYTAVILCDRELRVYDLNNGKHMSTLKGVLNLKLPYFGVHNNNYTMVVSRNRMYINMFNNLTGDVATTFKIGEDRFLNSLLVSENGEKCVCGDDVFKPSPLLVWDLKHRKLIHDLRIRGHEFLTKIASVSNDGKYVVCASREIEHPDPNVLLVYDLNTGTVFTKLKPEYSCTAVALAPSGDAVISAHENGDVLVWDFNDCVGISPKFVLKGHSIGPSCIYLSQNGARGITYDGSGRDPVVYMWDFQQGTLLGCVQSFVSPSCCQISADGDTVIICYPGDGNIFTFHHSGNITLPNAQTVQSTAYGDVSRKGQIFYLGDSSESLE